MSTRMTINGVSTCQTAGTEKYESFQLGYGRKRRTLVQYDYRHHKCNLQIFLCLFLEKLNMPQDTPVTNLL